MALARSPRDLLPYARHLPVWGRQPVDLELPWFSFGAIRFLESWVKRQHKVFEFGSGGSTFFFGRRAGHITSMESHTEWHSRVQTLFRERGITNLDCELHPLADGQLEGYRQSPFFQRVLAGQWDIIVIDCFCGFLDGSYGQLRRYAFELSLNQVAPGGLIILDDSWLYSELLIPRVGWEIRNYVGIGPCRYGVTSTAILRRLV
jgi:hypothetical protein